MSSSPEHAGVKESKRRLAYFALILIVAIVVACLYVARASQRIANEPARNPATPALTLETVRARPHVMFLTVESGVHHYLALAPLDGPEQRVVTDVECARFHYQRGAGVALGGPNAPGGAWFLDSALKKTRAISIAGVPSRARVSPDGRRAAMTFFVSGDSYETGGFSTRSYVLDLTDPSARPFDLEDLTLLMAGTKVDAPDINYWGVTFPRDDTSFFATVSTNGRRYLVRGRTDKKEAVVLHDDVECPSLSPNGRLVAFKRRVGSESSFEWRLGVLDLERNVVRNLEAETRHVDDQVEWLDDDHLLYAVRDATAHVRGQWDVWLLAIDDKSQPTLFLKAAMSPAVVRP